MRGKEEERKERDLGEVGEWEKGKGVMEERREGIQVEVDR